MLRLALESTPMSLLCLAQLCLDLHPAANFLTLFGSQTSPAGGIAISAGFCLEARDLSKLLREPAHSLLRLLHRCRRICHPSVTPCYHPLP